MPKNIPVWGKTALLSAVIGLTWQFLEISYYGEIQPRPVDNVIMLIIVFVVYVLFCYIKR